MHSIGDVAERAGVSVKTVSRILSGHAGVRPETRERVERAMEELEYYPSAAARSLRGKKMGTLSVIGDNLTTTPDAFEIVAGIQAECEKQARILMIGETGGRKATFDKLVERYRQQRTDAIIYATMFLQELTIDQSFRHCPLVLVNCTDSSGLHPAIIPDDVGGGFAAATELLGLGHRRIAFIGLFEGMTATQMRKRGYTKALKQVGIELDPTLIVTGVSRNESDEFELLPSVIEKLFALPDPPTAIMCGNDKMAMRVYFLLRSKMDKRIPEDVSIVGYDDYRLISENLVPKLTTVSLPYFEMGQEAARLALSHDLKPGVKKISGTLIARDSTAELTEE